MRRTAQALLTIAERCIQPHSHDSNCWILRIEGCIGSHAHEDHRCSHASDNCLRLHPRPMTLQELPAEAMASKERSKMNTCWTNDTNTTQR